MTNHVFETMGTVVSLRFRDDEAPIETLGAVESVFATLDERYSLYKPDSELSRIASGELALIAASAVLLDTYALAMDWRLQTRGAFTPHRPDGVIDLSGVVKAIAIQRAADELETAGQRDWILNAGGDVLRSPAAADILPWTVGIVDPARRTDLLTSFALTGTRRACATSGSAERGDHIWRAAAVAEFDQVTVLADDILTADVLATAIVAGGNEALELACRTWSIDVLAIEPSGALRMSAGAVDAMNAARGFADATRQSA